MELTKDHKLFLAAIVKRYPRYGTDSFMECDILPSTVRYGLTDDECNGLLRELVAGGYITKGNSGNHAFANGVRNTANKMLLDEERGKQRSELLRTIAITVASGLISGLLVAWIGWHLFPSSTAAGNTSATQTAQK